MILATSKFYVFYKIRYFNNGDFHLIICNYEGKNILGKYNSTGNVSYNFSSSTL